MEMDIGEIANQELLTLLQNSFRRDIYERFSFCVTLPKLKHLANNVKELGLMLGLERGQMRLEKILTTIEYIIKTYEAQEISSSQEAADKKMTPREHDDFVKVLTFPIPNPQQKDRLLLEREEIPPNGEIEQLRREIHQLRLQKDEEIRLIAQEIEILRKEKIIRQQNQKIAQLKIECMQWKMIEFVIQPSSLDCLQDFMLPIREYDPNDFLKYTTQLEKRCSIDSGPAPSSCDDEESEEGKSISLSQFQDNDVPLQASYSIKEIYLDDERTRECVARKLGLSMDRLSEIINEWARHLDCIRQLAEKAWLRMGVEDELRSVNVGRSEVLMSDSLS
jgi:hypothetical protein